MATTGTYTLQDFIGDLDRITRETGWRPEIPWTQTLADLLQDWRARITA